MQLCLDIVGVKIYQEAILILDAVKKFWSQYMTRQCVSKLTIFFPQLQ